MLATIDNMAREPKPQTVTVRLAKELARQLRIVAAVADMDVPDYLAQILKPILAKEMKKAARNMDEDTDKG